MGTAITNEFSNFGEGGGGVSKTDSMGFWRADFHLFGRLVQRVPWEAILKGRGAQEGWAVFKKEILNVQELSLPVG